MDHKLKRELAEAIQYQWDLAYPTDAPHDLDEAAGMADRAVKNGTAKHLLKLVNEWISDNEPLVEPNTAAIERTSA